MSSPRALRIAAACAWLVAASASDARAADPAPAAGTSGEADRFFDQGVAAQKASKFPEAEALFLKAWAIKKTWDIAANLGLVELKQGKLADGAGHVAYAIANLPPTEGDTVRTNLARAFEAARVQVAELKVTCNVEGATVRVGGKVVGTTPLATSVFATPGTIAIEITKDSYQPVTKSVEAKKGAVETVKAELVPVTVPTATATATVVPTGTATVQPPKSMVPAYVVGGVGVASAIVGGVLMGVAFGSEGDIKHKADAIRASNASCPSDPRCSDLANASSGADTMSRVGLGMLIGGVVVGAAAGAYIFWPSSHPKQGTFRMTPTASREGGGIVFTGKF
ncbi:MAG: PEGA domain-containing protein [Polyangiaceae bacterium]